MPMPKNNIDDFWKYVNKNGNCWIWNGYLDRDGYGHFKMDYRDNIAHRLSYQISRGDIPEGLCVCHSCDNPACVNPAHLFLGTQADNVRDRDRKGRMARVIGEDNPNSKLTSGNIVEIRGLFKAGKSKRSMAKMFSISHREITRIINGERWGWLA